MIQGKKIAIVLPAYNAARTLEQTFRAIPTEIADEIILVDDASSDDTVALAHKLGIKYIIRHSSNRGYGANQKTCYQYALATGADIIIMLHPDYQYTPALIPSMAYLIANNIYPVVLGSRILGKGALQHGMPLYKYVFNRLLTFTQNLLLRQKLSEYHTGYRAFSKEVLTAINFMANDDDFVFDNQVLMQIFFKGYVIGEISCPANYFAEASSINFFRSVRYGAGVLINTVVYLFNKWGIASSPIYQSPVRQ